MVRPFCAVLQQYLCRAGRRGVQDGAIYCNGNCGLPGQRFSVNNHKFGAPVGSWKIKHANPRCLLGEGKTVLSLQLADGSSVGSGILGLHRVIVGETFDFIDELQSAEISGPVERVAVSKLVARKELLELFPIKALDCAAASGLHKQMFGFDVSIKVDDLPAKVTEILVRNLGAPRVAGWR
jgi:hypothetical protein